MSKHHAMPTDPMLDNRYRAGWQFAQRELTDEPAPIRSATAAEFRKQAERLPAASDQHTALLGALAYLDSIHDQP